MRKRSLALVLAALLLFASGCQAPAPKARREKPDREPSEASARPSEEPTEQPPEELDRVEYEIIKQDESIRDEGGKTLVSLLCDHVVVKGDSEVAERINAAVPGITAKDREEYASGMDMDDPWLAQTFPWESSVSAEVTHNGGGLFSVYFDSYEYSGGAHGMTVGWGMTFDLSTGEELTLAQLFPSTPESQLLETLRASVELWMTVTGFEADEYAPETLAGMGLEDFGYYVEKGELVITVPAYTFGPYSSGPMYLPTGIPVERFRNEEGEELWDRLGRSVYSLLADYGTDYSEDWYQGGHYLYFEAVNTEFYFNESTQKVFGFLCGGHLPIGWGLTGDMTYPELQEALEDRVTLDEPSYGENVETGEFSYNLSFELDGAWVMYEWYEDPETSPADTVQVLDYQLLDEVA